LPSYSTTCRTSLLLRLEQRRLVRVDADADDELVEQPVAALDHVEVPQVDGVERAGVDGDALVEGLGHRSSPRRVTSRSISSTVL
jgi:hypothetical protein